jgi:SpoIID/LytB domain protein
LRTLGALHFLSARLLRVSALRTSALCVLCSLCVLVTGSAQSGIRIGVQTGATYTVTVLPLDTYVARVLAGEAAPNTAPAALEALAIAVRTYTAANMGKHRAEGFDLCDQTHCQVMRTANADTERASKATAGLVLLDGALPATIYYSASCGGHTERPSAVWPASPDPPCASVARGRRLPRLPGVERGTGGGRPAASAGGRRIQGTLRNLRIASRNGSGRRQAHPRRMTPSEISGQDLRMAVGPTLGWLRILQRQLRPAPRRHGVSFAGRGSGHGVGCASSAPYRAEAGESAASILAQYYPGLRIAPHAPPAAAPSPPPVATEAAVVPRRPDLNLVLPRPTPRIAAD